MYAYIIIVLFMVYCVKHFLFFFYRRKGIIYNAQKILQNCAKTRLIMASCLEKTDLYGKINFIPYNRGELYHGRDKSWDFG